MALLGDEPSAKKLYEQGRKAEKAGHMAQAYFLYSEAAALDPNNQDYWFRSQAVRSRAALESIPAPPVASKESEDDLLAQEHVEAPTPAELAEARKPLPPSELKAQPGTKDFDL